ncbi:Autophagy protein 22, partial [Cladochytrium tenue]
TSDDSVPSGAKILTESDEIALARRIELSHHDLDETPVSHEELKAWYAFAITSEPFSAAATAVFIPIILQSMAAHSGFERSDHSVPCDTSATSYTCDVLVGQLWVATSSFVYYCTSITVIIQVLLFIALGSLADFGHLYWLAALYFILGGTVYGFCFIFYYAWVPILSRNHPEVIKARNDPNVPLEKFHNTLDYWTNYISSRGFVWAYVGGVSAIILSVAVEVVGKAVGKCTKLGNLFLFLIGWFIYSDTFNTISSTAILYAQTQLGFSTIQLLILGVEAPLAGGIGAFVWNFIQRHTKLTTKQILVIQVCIYAILPLWGVIGFIGPSPIGLKHAWEMFFLAAWHGFLLGGTQSTCRSLFSQLLPPGMEAEFFSLYEITDRGSSWVGPLVVGAINDSTGDLRKGFIFVLASMLFSLPFFLFLNVEKGINQGREFASSERKRIVAEALASNEISQDGIALKDASTNA